MPDIQANRRMTGEDRTATSKELLESDLETLFKLTSTNGRPVVDGDIRAASTILRRWLCEHQIGRLCNSLGVIPTFPILDNETAIAAIQDAPDIRYYLTGGVRFDGRPIMHVYSSSLPATKLPIAPMSQVYAKTKGLLGQRRVYFGGQFFTCEDIIRFTANKAGGVHLDFDRNDREDMLQEAARYMTFGGPSGRIERGTIGEMHLELEPHGQEALSCLHFEIVAAANSFLGIHLDGKPLLEFSVKRSVWSRVRDTLGIRRKPRIRLHDFAPPRDRKAGAS